MGRFYLRWKASSVTGGLANTPSVAQAAINGGSSDSSSGRTGTANPSLGRGDCQVSNHVEVTGGAQTHGGKFVKEPL